MKYNDNKIAKSMIAMTKINDLMPQYGGVVTDDSWRNTAIKKYVIERYCGVIDRNVTYTKFNFLAFYTVNDCDRFINDHLDLIKDYYMM